MAESGDSRSAAHGSSDEVANDDEMAVSPAEPLVEFPIDEYKKFTEGLNRFGNWIVYPSSLSECLKAGIQLVREGSVLYRCLADSCFMLAPLFSFLAASGTR